MKVNPVNLYNVDYFFEGVTWIDIKSLREDLRGASRVSDRGGDRKASAEAPGTTMKDSEVVLI